MAESDETDDDCCRVCGHAVNINPDTEWPDGQPICWECLWTERQQLADQNKALREALKEISGFNAENCDGWHMQDVIDVVTELAKAALTSTKGPQE